MQPPYGGAIGVSIIETQTVHTITNGIEIPLYKKILIN